MQTMHDNLKFFFLTISYAETWSEMWLRVVIYKFVVSFLWDIEFLKIY